MSWNDFPPYVSAAERRRRAEREVARRRKKGATITPVVITGRKIATTFWGAAWCDHLEGYSDYESRLPRGRTYARNGSVIHLEIGARSVKALVQGTDLYEISVAIEPLAKARWKKIVGASAGKIDSLVELLQGKLADAVMRVVIDRAAGLFPAPSEIAMRCTCPDGAVMCKHVAAVLYGVGARLDAMPELLFVLRDVNHLDLVAGAGASGGVAGTTKRAGRKVVAKDDLAGVFGIEIDPGGGPKRSARRK